MLIAAATPARANLVSDPGFESCTAVGQTPPELDRDRGVQHY
jgi:hypothetical protein